MKKKLFLTLTLLLLPVWIICSPSQAKADDLIPVYRLYMPTNGEHLYTTDAHEKDVLYTQHKWGYEGIGWYTSSSGTPVYRLYNPGLRNHLYTTDTNEVETLCRYHGWQKDNNGRPVFYSSGNVPIYRLYNRGLKGMHHLTTDVNEYNTLPRHGWTQEGIKLYGVQLGNPIQTKYTPEVAAKMAYKKFIQDQGSSIAGYYIHDLNADGISELIVQTGTAQYNTYGSVYSYNPDSRSVDFIDPITLSNVNLCYPTNRATYSAGPLWSVFYSQGYGSIEEIGYNGYWLTSKDVEPYSRVSIYYLDRFSGRKVPFFTYNNLRPLNY